MSEPEENKYQAVIRRTISKLHNAILLSGLTAEKEKVAEYVTLGFPKQHEIAYTLKQQSILSAVSRKLIWPCLKVTKYLVNSTPNKQTKTRLLNRSDV